MRPNPTNPASDTVAANALLDAWTRVAISLLDADIERVADLRASFKDHGDPEQLRRIQEASIQLSKAREQLVTALDELQR